MPSPVMDEETKREKAMSIGFVYWSNANSINNT